MKDIHELSFPDDLMYADDHEWVRREGDTVRIGISDYAQDQLGDIVFVELPEVGSQLDVKAEFGTVESVKAVSELFMPLGGEIVATNTELVDSPELVNTEPYGGGWMLVVKPQDPDQIDALMKRDDYVEMLKTQS